MFNADRWLYRKAMAEKKGVGEPNNFLRPSPVYSHEAVALLF